jgi:hypothetical protein
MTDIDMRVSLLENLWHPSVSASRLRGGVAAKQLDRAMKLLYRYVADDTFKPCVSAVFKEVRRLLLFVCNPLSLRLLFAVFFTSPTTHTHIYSHTHSFRFETQLVNGVDWVLLYGERQLADGKANKNSGDDDAAMLKDDLVFLEEVNCLLSHTSIRTHTFTHTRTDAHTRSHAHTLMHNKKDVRA